ncbi:MAG: efflux RND transporter periplasmic adaptor subunit [Lachnospiraceae bacterium]|nr:efflux RND transporter periplasmic adaptor subunit [Lachnospiraceae bacterium]MBR5766395.1 efflux RND transporter periplasmic adaptor subunit [Lachnospiraceae bacterium]MBR6469111.1 efflux RND transporter periplasmic adaptor subunit [Lachnospiraceae bacterium]MBR6486469.1 efflux RND transporter periplasmic adaptor subunit [Lachnospiraceae bacterium]
MKKFFEDKKKIIIGGIAAFTVAVVSVTMHVNAALAVDSYIAGRGSINSVIELNGNVGTNEEKTYYTPSEVRISRIHIKQGDHVNKGDLLISYDEDYLEYMISLTGYNMESAKDGYEGTRQAGDRNAGLYSEAESSLSGLQQKIDNTQERILTLQNELTSRKAMLASEGARLQIELIDYEDNLDDDDDFVLGNRESILKDIQTNTYAQQFDSEIVWMQEELERLNMELASLKELKSEMTSQKMSTLGGTLTSGDRDRIDVLKSANELSEGEKIAHFEMARGGIVADYDGVVTMINATEGETVNEGTPVLTLESTEDIVVKCSVNKYDIDSIDRDQTAVVKIRGKEYSGKVTRIEGMTGTNAEQASNIGIEVSLDEPDDDIIIGLEVKTYIDTAHKDDALIIPLDALGTDEEGDYVFVERGKKAVRLNIETGIKNDEMIEVTSGLAEGDVVVWDDSVELSDGMDIKVK